MLMAGDRQAGRLRGLRWEARVHATVAAGLIRTLTCADVAGGGKQWWWTWTIAGEQRSWGWGLGVERPKGCHMSTNQSRQGWTSGGAAT
jgi:hypothetical protein